MEMGPGGSIWERGDGGDEAEGICCLEAEETKETFFSFLVLRADAYTPPVSACGLTSPRATDIMFWIGTQRIVCP
jgi:hypothetical protein